MYSDRWKGAWNGQLTWPMITPIRNVPGVDRGEPGDATPARAATTGEAAIPRRRVAPGPWRNLDAFLAENEGVVSELPQECRWSRAKHAAAEERVVYFPGGGVVKAPWRDLSNVRLAASASVAVGLFRQLSRTSASIRSRLGICPTRPAYPRP